MSSIVSEVQQQLFKGVGIFRDGFPVARYHFDLHVDDEGFAGFMVWARNTYRIPIISHIRDFIRRRERQSGTIDSALKQDSRNMYVAYKDVQGIVADDQHKELQILTNQEQFTILIRSPDDYEEFLESLKANIDDKIFSRQMVEIKSSVYH